MKNHRKKQNTIMSLWVCDQQPKKLLILILLNKSSFIALNKNE